MTIKSQRRIFKLAKEGSITNISSEAISFEYGAIKELAEDSVALIQDGFSVMMAGNQITVMSIS